jgi:hypothetical protein
MTKTHKTTPSSGDTLEQDLVTLVLGPLSDLVEKTRLEILQKIEKLAESVNIIARQIKRQIPHGE